MVEGTLDPRTPSACALQTIPLQEPSGHPLPGPSVVKHSLSICAALCCPGDPVLWATWEEEVVSPGSITALSQTHTRPAGRGCHLSFVPPPRPISTFLLAPGVRGGPTGTALWSVRAPGEAVVVTRDRAPSHRPSPSSPGSSFPHVHASGLFQSKLPGVLFC